MQSSTFTATVKVVESSSVLAYEEDQKVIFCDETNPTGYIESDQAILLEKMR